MEKELNKLLADLVVEYHKLQSFHWYLKGYHFFDDHAKLEEYYDSVAEAVDGVCNVSVVFFEFLVIIKEVITFQVPVEALQLVILNNQISQ